MLTRRLGILSIGALMMALVAAPVHAGSVSSYIIETTNSNWPSNMGGMVTAAGGALKRSHPGFGVAQATSADPAFATKMAATPGIQSVTLDTIVQWVPPVSAMQATVALSNPPAAAPNPQGAFFYGCQWNMQQINAPGAWAQGAFGSPAAKVAVLDTGVDPNHIDLAGHVDLAESVSEITPGTSPCGSVDETTTFDYDFHGTFTSSQVTGNLIGMAAMAPKTDVVMVKVLNCVGSGLFSDVIAGIEYAAGLKDVQVLNMSIGAYFPKAGNDALIDAVGRAVLYARNHGKLVAVAAGNNSAQLSPFSANIDLPAQSPGATAVYATSITQTLASYSNFGGLVSFIGAPGGDTPDPLAALPGCPINPSLQSLVLGACSSAVCAGENFYLVGDGTSFASPLVAGLAAQIDGVHAECRNNPGEVEAVLAFSATPIGSFLTYGFGEVNAGRAVLFQHFIP
jgi:subtilisin family serine protease